MPGKYWPPQASTRPMTRPPTSAPYMLPRPPSTATTKDIKVNPAAADGLNVPTVPIRVPAIPASPAAIAKVRA